MAEEDVDSQRHLICREIQPCVARRNKCGIWFSELESIASKVVVAVLNTECDRVAERILHAPAASPAQ